MKIDPMDRIINVSGTQKISTGPQTVRFEKHVNESQENQPKNVEDTIEDLKKSFEKIKTFLKSEAEFTIDRELNMIIIKIKNIDTGEIIRQIPPEVAVKIAKNLQELIGILFDERA
ncbi:flagellar protein FlaG [Thermotoga profunda]|uniref:flagellar protein FlaG n=1 Tax=Thermotoga profunda TaxID=1508420 RepID=UPI0005970BC8|nr:flagellar protein FlaG [Thermotoga profunda]